MSHREIHDQGVRGRKEVVLCLRFLQDHTVFDFEVTSFFASCRGYCVDLNPMTHGTE